MESEFYDKVAKKFGSYQTKDKHFTEYPGQEPEVVFKEKLLELSGGNKVALDIGCADGRFTLSIASYFRKIVAIDLSKGMLKAAERFQKEGKVSNVSFEMQDARKIRYRDGFFDIAYSRRGPSSFTEIYRLLKTGGYFIEIDIGERDCRQIKQVFGRGQGFGQWNSSRLRRDKQMLEAAGFNVVFAKDYIYEEYYASFEDLDLFLQGVPIFEDFDSEKDKKLLERYAARFKTRKGIKLPRHRVVTVSRKG